MSWRKYQASQKVVQLGDSFVSYVDEGQGPEVVLIHGIPTWGYVWNDLIPILAKGYRVLVPDLLGFGFSDRGDHFDRSIAAQAQMIDDWMGALGLTAAAVVGHDIGGGVAQQLAVFYPERVRRMCLMNSVAYDSWPHEFMLQLGHPEAVRKLSSETFHRLLKIGVRRGFATTPSEAEVDALVVPYQNEVGKVSLVRNAVALDTNRTMELVPHYAQLTKHTLIVWGEDDSYQSVEFGERLHDDLPSSRLVRVPNAKHFVMRDQLAEVATHLVDFLSPDRRAAALEVEPTRPAP
jgi:pimeloyl-ACP methyl ester carboxylesterase